MRGRIIVSRKRAQPDSANHHEEREARVAEMMARARRRQQKVNLHHEEGVGVIAEVEHLKKSTAKAGLRARRKGGAKDEGPAPG